MAFKMKGPTFFKSALKHKTKKDQTKEEYDANHPGEPNKDGHGPKGHHQQLDRLPDKPLKMASPLEHKATEEVKFKSGQKATTADQHNKTYGTPEHHDSEEKKAKGTYDPHVVV
jgi:hypothetical protein